MDHVQVTGAVLDDNGKLSKLVVEQEDHTTRTISVSNTTDSSDISAVSFGGEALAGGRTLESLTWTGSTPGSPVVIGAANEDYWGSSFDLPIIEDECAISFSLVIAVTVGVAELPSFECGINLAGAFDAEGSSELDLMLVTDGRKKLGVGTHYMTIGGSTPKVPAGTEFQVMLYATHGGGSTATAQATLLAWKA